MPRYASEAERLRAHREAFNLALELGCTPREAERELRRRKLQRLAACGTRAPDDVITADLATDDQDMPGQTVASFEDWDARWMMRS